VKKFTSRFIRNLDIPEIIGPRPKTGQKWPKKDTFQMSNRNKSIEAQTIAKAMISHGYDPEDSKTRTVADFWMAWIETQAGPEEAEYAPVPRSDANRREGWGYGPGRGDGGDV
jgi:hypothetical protein